jgi:hypothetical protein
VGNLLEIPVFDKPIEHWFRNTGGDGFSRPNDSAIR